MLGFLYITPSKCLSANSNKSAGWNEVFRRLPEVSMWMGTGELLGGRQVQYEENRPDMFRSDSTGSVE